MSGNILGRLCSPAFVELSLTASHKELRVGKLAKVEDEVVSLDELEKSDGTGTHGSQTMRNLLLLRKGSPYSGHFRWVTTSRTAKGLAATSPSPPHRGPALGTSEPGSPVAFLLALLLKGLAPLKAHGPPCKAVPAAQAAGAINRRNSRFHQDAPAADTVLPRLHLEGRTADVVTVAQGAGGLQPLTEGSQVMHRSDCPVQRGPRVSAFHSSGGLVSDRSLERKNCNPLYAAGRSTGLHPPKDAPGTTTREPLAGDSERTLTLTWG
ncbi:unnamed protein product [Rangifer tarandus platyrhynchus]|uniref:Uncharacterized protein n=2 Tax=Rangifer tarandus platyrhynchus TaxID=3082113 RepID=A0ABN8ZU98_RANTA|nr:unnamed protein product [Rangifer tarandus platyrhynchus]